MEIKPWLTAIHRKKISLPLQKILKKNYISNKDVILDYGCGHGCDLNYLKDNKFHIEGYDKFISTYSNQFYYKKNYDKVFCFYVLNTIHSNLERIETLNNIFKVLKNEGSLFIAVRSIEELKSINKDNLTEYNDGYVTIRGTFQKYFTKEDLENLLHKNFKNINITYIPFNNKTILAEIKILQEAV